MKYLFLKHVHKSYSNGSETLTILNDINLWHEQSEKIIISGESGSGKSTLLNIIGTLDHADSGKIKVGEWSVSDMTENEMPKYRSSEIGFIFQFHYLLKDFSALENIMLPYYLETGNKKIALEKAEELINKVNLWNRRTHLPSQLSGGERQRIAAARSLINEPNLILADEPTGNLDENNSRIITEILFNLVDEYKKGLILVSHDVSLSSHCDVHYHLERGVLNQQ